jgi:hypothetical protein
MGPRGIHAKGKHGLVDWDVPGCGVHCSYCKREMIPYSDTHPTRDHVYPKSLGGTRTVWACVTCNQMKADMLPDHWDAFMAANPGWWNISPSLCYVKPCPVMEMVSQFFMERRYPYLKRWYARSP